MKYALTLVPLVGVTLAAIFYQCRAGDPTENTRGQLVLCGGSLEFDQSSRAAEALRALAASLTKDGKKPKLASVQSGAPSLKDSEAAWNGDPSDPGYNDIFTGLGFDPFLVPLTVDHRGIQSDEEWVKRVEDASVVFLNGGDQIRHTRSLLLPDDTASPMLIAIKKVLEKGGAVISTSAGTHAASAVMFGGGTSDGALRSNRTYALPKGADSLSVPGDREEVISSYGTGLGLLPGVLLDSHVAARGRVGRLLVALATIKRDGAAPTEIGIGVDENTCLFWDIAHNTGKVRGQHSVWILDIGRAVFAPDGTQPFYASQVSFSAASHGDDLILSRRDPPGDQVTVKSERLSKDSNDDVTHILPNELFSKGAANEWVKVSRTANTRMSKADDGSISVSNALLTVAAPAP